MAGLFTGMCEVLHTGDKTQGKGGSSARILPFSLASGPNTGEEGLISLIAASSHAFTLSPQGSSASTVSPQQPFSTQQPTCTTDLSNWLLIIIYFLPSELTVASKICKICLPTAPRPPLSPLTLQAPSPRPFSPSSVLHQKYSSL